VKEGERRRKGKEEKEEVGPRDFKFLTMLGAGDVGKVYLARKRGTKDLFAVKILQKKEMVQRKKVKRVLVEREILSIVDHPFIVSLHWSFQSLSQVYYVMEFCAGGGFYRMLSKLPERRLLEDPARFYSAEVLLALEYLHMQGFIYRDLKPENILIHHTGHIKLADFDLSKTSNTPVHSRLTDQVFVAKPTLITNSFVGTAEYIAPEIITGFGHTSTVDWWTFGILLYEMLFGFTPFASSTQSGLFENVLHQEVEFPERIPISKNCRDFIRKLLKPDPKKRLGAVDGAPDLKNHNFYSGVKFSYIRNLRPPFTPKLSCGTDTRYFQRFKQKDSGFTFNPNVDSDEEEDTKMKRKPYTARLFFEPLVRNSELPEGDPFRNFGYYSKSEKKGY